MLDDLLKNQKKSIDHFFDHFDVSDFQNIFNICVQCTGVLVFTGVGKSGIIAQKISQTLLSTGTKSIFLPPTNALHGDIGILSDQDLFFCLSKSGQTKELIDLIAYVKKRGAKIVSITSDKHSYLAKKADVSVYLPVEKELCPFNLAPTISTTVQLLFGDALAIALMKAKNFSLDEYALNHPAGTIGKKTSIYVEDIMIQKSHIPTSFAEDLLIEKIAELSSKKCGCLIVINDERKVLGVFTDGDLRRGLEMQGEKILRKPLGELMTQQFSFTTPDKLAWHALQQMEENPKKLIAVLPVIQNSTLVGIIRMHDILQMGIR